VVKEVPRKRSKVGLKKVEATEGDQRGRKRKMVKGGQREGKGRG